MRQVAVLGSTGSIGRNTLDVIAHHPDQLRIVALTAQRNWRLLAEQARRFRPHVVCIGDTALVDQLKSELPAGIDVVVGEQGLVTCAGLPQADTIVVAVVGAAGMKATHSAVCLGKRVCLANKESLVAGGNLIMQAAAQHGAELLPIDSEHSAIFQCRQTTDVVLHKIYLTASGGPFRTMPLADMANITPAAALKHPTWNMGGKITIDSATMMNKGLEVIEAHWLFNVPYDQIQVVVHPQSVIHSMIELADGSILAQLGAPDMRLPIQVALLHPQRLPSPATALNPVRMGTLTFEEPDVTRFPSLTLAYAAGQAGGSMPTVLNAANEVAVRLFLQERLRFTDIPRLVDACMQEHVPTKPESIEAVLTIDKDTRQLAEKLAGKMV
jgi:1-deoxy-D-xylulose-5-phosphate reductoisomerase